MYWLRWYGEERVITGSCSSRSGEMDISTPGSMVRLRRWCQGMRIDRYKNHDIEVVIDRLSAQGEGPGAVEKIALISHETGQGSDHDPGKGRK